MHGAGASADTGVGSPLSAPSSFSFNGHLDVALRLKEEGNALLNLGDYEEACAKYEEGLRQVDFGPMIQQMAPAERSQLTAIRVPLLLNATLCDLRMHPEDQTVRLHQSERRIAEVLAEQPDNTKALFRRAQLHGRAGEYAMARSLLEKLCQQDPSERAFRIELLSIVARGRKERKETARFWSAALDRQKGRHRAAVDDLESGALLEGEHGDSMDTTGMLRSKPPWAQVQAACLWLLEELLGVMQLLFALFGRMRLNDRAF